MALHQGKQIPTVARMYTRRGWMHGTMRLVPNQTVMDFLDHSNRFITFTKVQLAAYEQEVDYLSFQREAIGLFLAPEGSEWKLRAAEGQVKSVRVLCLFDQGAVRGTLDIPARVRVSDYFMNRDGFVQLTNAHVRLPDPQGQRTNEVHPLAIVNSAHILGVSEVAAKEAPAK